jgi:secreted trypsin-like serine protease
VIPRDGGFTQIGILSFGLSDGCDSDNPSGYTRVTFYRNWIVSKLESNKNRCCHLDVDIHSDCRSANVCITNSRPAIIKTEKTDKLRGQQFHAYTVSGIDRVTFRNC